MSFDARMRSAIPMGFGSLLIAATLVLPVQPTQAQPKVPSVPESADARVPGFWDPWRRPERPDLTRIRGIRFLTEIDYPPFNYAGPNGHPAGFNVDIARLICEEIKVTCTVQMRRFDTLLDALNENRGDAVIASLAATPQNRQRADFTDPYYRTPARFIARKDAKIESVAPEDLAGKKVAVVAGTAHEAYLRTLFTDVEVKVFRNKAETRAALVKREVDLVFGDGISLAFWLNGTDSAGCCTFRGGPFTESRYFGEGIGIAVRKGDNVLRQALNWALFRLWERGQFTDLWLRYFPVNPF